MNGGQNRRSVRPYTSSRLTYLSTNDTPCLLRSLENWIDDGTGRINLEIVAHRRADAALLLSVDHVGSLLRLGGCRLPAGWSSETASRVLRATPARDRAHLDRNGEPESDLMILNYRWTESPRASRRSVRKLRIYKTLLRVWRGWTLCMATTNNLSIQGHVYVAEYL